MNENREQGKVFADRRQAGIELAGLLERKYRGEKPLVLGIPRGGVPIAHEIASRLNAELSVVITKKLPHPRQLEYAIGAAAEDGSTYLSSAAMGIDPRELTRIIGEQLNEIRSRVARFRDGKPLPLMFNRTVILADDGIATGSTIVPAIKLCKSQKAGKVVVAAPVASRELVDEIRQLADEVVIAERPLAFHSVSQVYGDFHHLSDEEVIALLNEHARHHAYH